MVQSLDEARRRQSNANRVPPHNLEAERSLLGAMLLSRDAIASAVETCSTDDFYKPGHAHVFDAVTTLYGQGEPADPLTVADVLGRAGLLESAGGLPALVALQADTPATANAARYARIVEEHALLRKLIGAAGEIAELGYSVPDDVADAVDRAESLVFGIAERRVTDTLKPLKELLEESLDRLATLFNRSESITGVPTGFHDLDERLSGLQPSALVIVGARPAMGKALALDTPIPTPSGWTSMGELRSGDRVLDDGGRPCRVTYVSPIYTDRRCYRVVFDDGSTLVADAEHQWVAGEQAPGSARGSGPTRVVTTQEMVDAGVCDGGGVPRWHVPLAGPLDLPARDLPVDPYVLGSWLAGAADAGIEPLDPAGDEHIAREWVLAGYPAREQTGVGARAAAADHRRRPGGSSGARGGAPTPRRELVAARGTGTVTVAVAAGLSPGAGGVARDLGWELRCAGLGGAGDRSGEPRIPVDYLRGSIGQRLALLQGLLDRAGAVDLGGWVECRLTSLSFALQARELACSLGEKVGPVRRTEGSPPGRPHCPAWRFRWQPSGPMFRMAGKAACVARAAAVGPAGPAGHAIRLIHPVPTIPVRCITVDSPEHLYLAGESMIPTHNTAFSLGIAAHATMVARVPTLVFSLEMSHAEITQRLLVSEARVDSSRVRNGRLHDSDWPKISNAVGRLGEAPLYIDDNPNLTVMEVRAKARRLKARDGGLGLIIIDYLQLMSGRSSAESRQVEVSEISRGLKILARELDVPVVALSQLSRNLETRSDKRPVLADLRESGSLEQDADVVMFLYRDEMYNPESNDRGTAEVIVAKHRNGPTGTTNLAFLDHYTRFADMARV